MGTPAPDCDSAMNKLQAVILVVLAIGTVSVRGEGDGKRACEIDEDAQVVLADRVARKLHTWTPNDCTPQTFESYPVRKKEPRYAASLHQCSGVTFVKNEGDTTKLVAYNQQTKQWERVKMPKELRRQKVSNYAVTTYRSDSKLLIIGGRMLNGTALDTIWALDCQTFGEGKLDWQKLDTTLAISGYGSCAVTLGAYLIVMSGMTGPGKIITKVSLYNLNTNSKWEGSQEINDLIIDCNSFQSPTFIAAMAIGVNRESKRLQAYTV